MKKIEMNLKNDSYKIFLGEDIFKEIKSYLPKYEKILILTNDKIGSIYKDFLISGLEKESVFYFELNDGEENKNYSSIQKVYDFMVKNSFFRNSLIVSVGGGVVCDMGGFIASTYMRGIDFVSVPTSLLAMVDASIGGKVAINHGENKNLIGSFYQPKAVFIDIKFLKTLSPKEFASGMGEVIKHSLISPDKKYFNFLKREKENILKKNSSVLEEMIYLSCIVKKEIVTMDEKETGIRANLNLGHTYGHALESIFKYKGISHGEAVAKGIMFEIFAGGTQDKKLIKEIKEIFKDFNLDSDPIRIETSVLLNALKKDKKNSVDKIKIISFKNFGEVLVETISEETIEKLNRFFMAEVRAIIDIGTNSVRMFVSVIDTNGEENKILKSLCKEVEITSLGVGVDCSKKLSEEAMCRTLKTIEKFYKIAKSYGSLEVKAMATSAVRDALNREEFLSSVREIGVEANVISGELEALLSFKAISNMLNEKDIVIVDIGGGSTEISYGEKSNLEFSHSYNVGAIRVTELFFREDEYTEESIEIAKKWIRENLSEIEKLKNKKFKLLGVAGTVTTLVSVYEKMNNYNAEKVHGYILTKKQIEKSLKLFLNMDLERRKKIPGLQPKRAPYVVAGTIIILEILSLLERKEITVSETDNLEGAAMLLGRISYEEL
ncbi:MAG: 3-dehydroquinate synthase [Fusobacteriaceae bacterium]